MLDFNINDIQIRRFETLYADYKRMYDDPDNCRPRIIIDTPVEGLPSWKERLEDPLVMLQAELMNLQPHLEIQDDRVPTVRVQFGTAQIAAAFGCEMHLFDDNLPCAESHPLKTIESVFDMEKPSLDAGWFGKQYEWTEIWKEHLPEGVHIQHPDIQSAFNSAHLIRGNDILMDFYDHPEALQKLLDLVTDYMIDITLKTKAQISDDTEWFFDWGCLWKGAARISNCSMQMIAPDMYRQYVMPRDIRFFEAVGGGRMHYCGIHGDVIDAYFTVPTINGLDVDCSQYDLFDICKRAPKKLMLCPTCPVGVEYPTIQQLLAGEWPEKRNIVVYTSSPDTDSAKTLLNDLRDSIPY